MYNDYAVKCEVGHEKIQLNPLSGKTKLFPEQRNILYAINEREVFL